MPPVRHRWDATTVLGLLALLFGVAWLLGAVHALHVPIEGVLALGLMLLGAAMVVTGRTDWSLSRRTWPVWLGLGLVVALFATSSAFGLGSGASDLSFGNRGVRAVAGQTVHGGFGDLQVNASDLHSGDSLEVASVAGKVAVQLPPGTAVSVDARLVAGQICVNGHDVADGPHAQYRDTIDGTGPPLELNVHEVFGQIQIGTPGCHHR
ncbi:MAG: hypothetical protein ACRDWW_03800 [Acidimicrobiales bacterium]